MCVGNDQLANWHSQLQWNLSIEDTIGICIQWNLSTEDTIGICIQWDLSIVDTIGTQLAVLYREVSVIQR